MSTKIDKIKRFAKQQMTNYPDSAHNMDHVMRVYNLAMTLAKNQKVDLEVIKIAVLLHDIGKLAEETDPTNKIDHAIESAKLAKPFLKKLKLSNKKIDHIINCIIAHRYRNEQKPQTLEAKIVFDADKLETIGAIGIARAFIWIGKHNAHIYRKMDIDKYARENLGGKINGKIQDKSKHSPQLNWETKEKYILEFLYTSQAKKIAKKRYKFYKNFLNTLEKEIQGLE